VAIHGLPGIGKTQLALHYAKKHKDLYPYVLFASTDTMDDFYTLVCAELGLTANSDEQCRAVAKRWLRNGNGERSAACLVIIDGASEWNLPFLEGFPRDIRDGRIVFTTSHRHMVERLDVDGRWFEVTCLENDGAIDLFSELLGKPVTGSELEAAGRVLASLNNHTLAITHVAQYMGTAHLGFSELAGFFCSSGGSMLRVCLFR